MSETVYFTPQEANRTLPLVKRIVRDIQETGRQFRGAAEKLGESATEDPEIRKQMKELEQLFGELEQIGCSYKDPNFALGLVDFPSIIDGQEVMLCWRSDEESVAFYHGSEGYSGRKPIPETYLDGPGAPAPSEDVGKTRED